VQQNESIFQSKVGFGQFPADQASFLMSAASRSITAIRGPQADRGTIHAPSKSTIRAGGSLSREKMRSDATRTEKYLMGRCQPIDFIRLRKSTRTASQPSNKLQSVIVQRLGTSTIK
jgi:hypothetical protein